MVGNDGELNDLLKDVKPDSELNAELVDYSISQTDKSSGELECVARLRVYTQGNSSYGIKAEVYNDNTNLVVGQLKVDGKAGSEELFIPVVLSMSAPPKGVYKLQFSIYNATTGELISTTTPIKLRAE